MKQPELGRKIAELRKSKGLTQEELVEKCRLNVRTLQRIESGEVTPRSYTLRVIFSELDYNYFEQDENGTGSNLHWHFSQFTATICDYFNFKKNTMKKTTILCSSLLVIVLGSLMISSVYDKQESKKVARIIELQNENSVRWFNEGKIDLLMDDYAVNSCFYRQNQPPCCGKEEIHELIKSASVRKLFRMENIEVISIHIDGTIAIEKSITTAKVPSGELLKTINLQEWHKIKGKWLIVNDMDVMVDL